MGAAADSNETAGIESIQPWLLACIHWGDKNCRCCGRAPLDWGMQGRISRVGRIEPNSRVATMEGSPDLPCNMQSGGEKTPTAHGCSM